MAEKLRSPRDVVGEDPALLAYWNQMPVHSQLRLLESRISVSTLGELKKLGEELAVETTVPVN